MGFRLALLLFLLVSTNNDQIMLARAAVAECGWHPTNCYAGVWHTIKNRAERTDRTIPEMVRAYCATWDRRTRDKPRARWVRELGPTKPQHWPVNVIWDKHVKYWERAYNGAGAFLQGKVKNPCHKVPVHFGARYGKDLANAVGWEALECGPTGRQGFYVLGR